MDDQEGALAEVEAAIARVIHNKKAADLSPQNSYIRRLQHQLVDKYSMRSESVGEEPTRRLRIYPS